MSRWIVIAYASLLVGAYACLLVGGCASDWADTWKVDDARMMKTQLAQLIPPGTPVEVARTVMEKEGFDCTVRRNATFIEELSLDEEEFEAFWTGTGKRFDFLDCHRSQNVELIARRDWSVAVVLQGNAVTDVLVSKKEFWP